MKMPKKVSWKEKVWVIKLNKTFVEQRLNGDLNLWNSYEENTAD